MLGAILSAPRKGTDKKPMHDITWRHFNNLSQGAKDSLHPVFLRRILLNVVPSIRAMRHGVVERSHPGITNGWQSRLSTVLLCVHKAEDREAANGHPVSPEPAIYHFILRHLSMQGNIFATEQVISDMKARGLPLTKKAHELRLTSLAQWLRWRAEQHARLKLSQSFKPGDRFTSLLKRESFFPEDAANLLNGLLGDLRSESMVGFRFRTLELLLRAAKEAGNEEAMVSILKDGYGVDLDNPDMLPEHVAANAKVISPPADSEWNVDVAKAREEQRDEADGYFSSATRPKSPYAPVNTNTLNTILDHLARRQDYWRTARIFEVLSQPLEMGVKPLDSAGAFLTDLQSKITSSVVKEVPLHGSTSVKGSVSDEESPPLTLSEAVAQEEASGEAINIFGKPLQTTSLDSSWKVEDAEAASHLAVPFSTFLSAMVSPSQIVEAIGQQADLSALLGNHDDQPPPANSTSFSLIIRSCANAALSANSSLTANERENAASMAVHYLRCSMRYSADKTNLFLVRFAAIEEEASRRIHHLVDSNDGDLEKKRKAIALWKASRRLYLIYPSSLTSHKQVTAVLRMGQSPYWSRKMGSRITRAALDVAREILEYQRDEVQVLENETQVLADETYSLEDKTTSTVATGTLQDAESAPQRSDHGVAEGLAGKAQSYRAPPINRLDLTGQIRILKQNIAGLEEIVGKR